MEARPTFLFVLLIALLAFTLPHYFRASAGNSPEPGVVVKQVTLLKSQINTIALVEPSRPVEAPALVEDLQKPLETVDQRGDAMLFEIDALQGMPFDEAIVKPFD